MPECCCWWQVAKGRVLALPHSPGMVVVATLGGGRVGVPFLLSLKGSARAETTCTSKVHECEDCITAAWPSGDTSQG